MSIEQEFKKELVKECKLMIKTLELNIRNIKDYVELLDKLDDRVEAKIKKLEKK